MNYFPVEQSDRQMEPEDRIERSGKLIALINIICLDDIDQTSNGSANAAAAATTTTVIIIINNLPLLVFYF